ncbi:hypothetical protein [Streptomyces javensis]|uniref:Uncharacterized protein n=1 Tax=Streptomyces javensis TaxID=114698 RepID=A0ABS0R3Y7_9ACTN|nr:hypothetical protein [Streptomyces javensis]MBI0312015.1 hypothetical protein [Streptomyces javensis]
MSKPPAVSCVEHGSPAPRRLSGAEAIVIIVIVGMAAGLVTLADLPMGPVLQLLTGAGLVAVLLVGLLTAGPLRAVRGVLGTLLSPTV